MAQALDTRAKEAFCQQLLIAVQGLISNKAILENNFSVQPLATLTKLVVRHRETIQALQVPCPWLVAILKGSKTLHMDGQSLVFRPGDLFLLPPSFTFDVINQPEQKGEYIALVLELSDKLLDRVQKAYPETINFQSNYSITRKCLNVNFDVPLSSSLIDALLHLIKGTVYENNKSAMLNEHHLIEVVLLLLQSDTRMLLLQSIYPDFLTQVRGLIDSDLSSNWSLERLAKELDMSISTLKRRLQNESLSYRQLLDKARMDKAIELLRNSSQSIAQIALACGYKSQSRFAARFRKYYALNPSDIRSGKTSSAHSH